MRRAVSVSLGSSARDKRVVINLRGVPVSVERIGTDGDVATATRLFAELDGKVDALGVGGARLRAHDEAPLLLQAEYHWRYHLRKGAAGCEAGAPVDRGASRDSCRQFSLSMSP